MKGYSCTNNDTVKKRHFIVESPGFAHFDTNCEKVISTIVNN